MATVVLYHSVLGLRPDIEALADELRAAGHRAHVPDLWDGETFGSIEEGLAKRDALGIPLIAERAGAAVEDLPRDLIYVGFSLGAAVAQMLCQTRPGSRGALLVSGAQPLDAFGGNWPAGASLQVHAMAQDSWVDLAVAEGLVDAVRASGQTATLCVYPGDGHLFSDSDLGDFDPQAARSVRKRLLEFVGTPAI